MSISLFNGLSGLSSHQRMLDVIANNIANLNTSGFKRSMMRMAEDRSQTIQPASASTTERGGVNPLQIGYGTRPSSATIDFAQGTLESTGRGLDMAISFNQDGSFAGVTGSGAGDDNITVTFNGLTTPQDISFQLGTTSGDHRIGQSERYYARQHYPL